LIAASLVLATATASHAAPGNHRPATWNMQGASSSSDSKWTTTVTRLSVGGNNYLPHDVVALQESGPRSSLPGTVVQSNTVTVNGRQATYQYEIRRWRIGSGSRGRDVYITWMNTDPTGNRNNVAIVTHEQPRNVTAVAARQANNSSWGMRPALGVQLSDGSWFYSFHASSNGDNRSNDAEHMMYEIASRGGQFAVLGDYNRRPDNLTNLPAGTQIYSSGHGTQQSGGELDYMVSNDRQNMQGWTGRRLNGAGSDHYAVEFTFAAASSEFKIQYGKDPRKCLNIRYDQSADVQGVCDDQGVEDFQFGGVHFLEVEWQNNRDSYCLDVRGEGTSNGTPIMGYTCGHGRNQAFRLTDDSAIVGAQSGKCVEASGSEKLIINECSPAKPEQEWIVRSVSPYEYGFLSRLGPTTGEEDSQTGGSGPSSDPSRDPNGLNPPPPPIHDETKRSIPDGTAYFENTSDVPIVDNRSNDSSISVTGLSGNAPAGLRVGVDITHTYRGDLVISLVGPSGRAYVLEDFDNSDSGDDVHKTYAVDASSETANGTWKLRVNDMSTSDTGTINAWNLTFSSGSGTTSGSGGGSEPCLTPSGSPC
ncbi:proprotein convertase P-domain-containing protein, partial [Streptomyces sp. NPDC006984]|uniref:proprotein convertase P-domain-containing protein n=1 Tax=Streptomyces sp. NPDC006984 TaxID=3155463 RepID=UPI0033C50942